MAEHPDEVMEITKTAQSLLQNLGNITDARIKSMQISAKAANEKNIPFTLDLVGIACSALRHKFACELILKTHPTVIKGNYSEINALQNAAYKSAGVDAENCLGIDEISKAALAIAKKYNAIILASGKADIITDGKKLLYIKNGTLQLADITGTGCMLGALCSLFLVADNGIGAAASACTVLGICGELAKTDKGNGTFWVKLMDNLSGLSDEDVEKYLKLEEKQVEKI